MLTMLWPADGRSREIWDHKLNYNVKNLQFIYFVGSLSGQNIILLASIFFFTSKHLPVWSLLIEKKQGQEKNYLNALFWEAQFCASMAACCLRRIL